MILLETIRDKFIEGQAKAVTTGVERALTERIAATSSHRPDRLFYGNLTGCVSLERTTQ